MKSVSHIIITHLVFLLLFGGISLAFAQENIPNTTNERQANLEERAAEMQENIQNRATGTNETAAERQVERQAVADERRAALTERLQERFTNLAANMSNRMEAAITRLSNIANRLESRIDKLQANNVDTAAAEATLASARLSLNEATTALTNIDIDVAEFVSAEDARTAWTTTRTQFVTARDHIKTAHTELRATIAALKSAVANTETGPGVNEAVQQSDTTTTPSEDADPITSQ